MALTPDEKKTVFYEGGRRKRVKLRGTEIVIGELPVKDLPKLFGCIEADAAELERAYMQYVRPKSKGFFKSLFGLGKPQEKPAVSYLKNLVAGITKNDFRLVAMSVLPFNEGMTEASFRTMFFEAPNSEIQDAIRAALEVNGIDLKNLKAIRGAAPVALVAGMMTSTAGSLESSNSRDGQEGK
jgi:hypothetical protein